VAVLDKRYRRLKVKTLEKAGGDAAGKPAGDDYQPVSG